MMKKQVTYDELKRIFSIAKKQKNDALASRYIKLAFDAARKSKIAIPNEIRHLYCSKCFSVFKKSNFSIRLGKGRKIVKCLKCGRIRRFPYR